MAEYINLAWPPTYRANSYQQQQQQQAQQQQQQQSHAQPQHQPQHQQLQQQQQQHHQFAVPNPQNPNINPNAGPSSRPQTQQAYSYGQFSVASPSTSALPPASTSTPNTASTSALPSGGTIAAPSASTSTSTPPAFRAPAHKHAHHLHSIPPREKSTRTLIIDHMLWVHGRTRFAQARAELGMTDRTGGPSSPHYPHRRRPESYSESDDELSAGEDTQPLRARQGDPGNPHADAEDALKGRQDLQLARSLRLRAEGVEKVVIGMLEGGPGGGGSSGSGAGAGAGGAGRPGVGRTGTGNSRSTGSGSSPNRLPNGVRLRLALGTIVNDLFARQAPPPPYRHTHSAAAAAASPSTSRTSGSTPLSTTEQVAGEGDEDEELPRALWTLAPASAAFVKPRRAKRKTKKKTRAQHEQRGHGHGHGQGPAPSYSGQQPMPSMTSPSSSSTPGYLDYSAQLPPPSGGAGTQWHPHYQALQHYSHKHQQHPQQYHGHSHSQGQSPQYQQYGSPMNQPTPPGQQRPSSSSSSMSMHPRPSSSSSAMMTPPIPLYQSPPHQHQHQQNHHQQRQHSHPYPQTTSMHTNTPSQPNPSSKPKTPLPTPSSRTTRLYSVGADPDTANSPPAFRCPRHLHTGCEICVEAKASVGAISAKGHGGPRDTRVATSPGGPSSSSGMGTSSGNGNGVTAGGNALSSSSSYGQTYTYAPGAGSSYAATQGQGLNSWRATVAPGGLAPGGGGITGWQDGSGIGSGLLRPGVRGSALRRKTVVPGYWSSSSSSAMAGGTDGNAANEGRGAGNTKLSRLIPRFIRLSALVAAELGRESRGEEAGAGVSTSGSVAGTASASASAGGDRQGQAEGGDRDRYTPPPLSLSTNSRRSSDVNVTPRQRQRTTTAGSASSVTPTRSSTQVPTQTQTQAASREKDKETSNANALRPTKEWYMLLAGLLTRAVLEGYLTGGWRGLRAVQCLLMVGLGVSDESADGAREVGKVRGKPRTPREVEEGNEQEEEEDASDADRDSDEESATDASSDRDDDDNIDTDTDDAAERLLGLGFRLPVAGKDDAADNEDGDEEFAELDPDELPDLVEAVRILFPSLRGWRSGSEVKAKASGKAREVSEREGDEDGRHSGEGGDGEDEEAEGRREGKKGEAEAEYEEEMLERLRRFYAIPGSTPDCATHMEDLAWQYPAEPVERAAVRFCEAIARWRGKPELETYKKKPAPNGAESGGMSIDALVHSNPVSPAMGAAHVQQQQQAEMESISAVLGASPPRKKRQPAIEDYFTTGGSCVTKMRQRLSLSPERGRQQGQQQQQQQQQPGPSENLSWARSGGGPNKRYREITDDDGRAEKRMYA